ncbi:MAG: hypothetical protein V2A65_10110 [Candidatus Omnitrophota bacterium]
MRLIGVDENGYGPLLGPLVVTAVSVTSPSAFLNSSGFLTEEVPDLWLLLNLEKQPGETPFVCDSKLVFGNSRKRARSAEDMVLGFFYLSEGYIPETADEFLDRILANPVLNVQFPCLDKGLPKGEIAFCWETDIPLNLSQDRSRKIMDLAAELKEKANGAGVSLERVRSLVVCPSLFNRALKSGGKNKSDLVVEAGLNLVRQSLDGEPFWASLGKVGGMRYYFPMLSLTFGAEHSVVKVREDKKISSYFIEGLSQNKTNYLPEMTTPNVGLDTVGKISYLEDGEDSSFLIALASLFGKYVRELFWQKAQAHLRKYKDFPTVSGYRDALTKRYVKEAMGLCKELGIPEECFLRCK